MRSLIGFVLILQIFSCTTMAQQQKLASTENLIAHDEAIENLAATEQLPEVVDPSQVWDRSRPTQIFSFKDEQKIEIRNPWQRSDLVSGVNAVAAMSLPDQIEFHRRRQDGLMLMARVLMTSRMAKVKTIIPLLEFFDSKMIESSEAVIRANDFGVTITNNVMAGILSPPALHKKLGLLGRAIGDGGGFMYGTGAGINLGYISSERAAYLEVVADFESLRNVQTPLIELSHSTRVFFYARSERHSEMSPIEVGRKNSLPVPLMGGMNTDRAFYFGASAGPSMLPGLSGIVKRVFFPLMDQLATYSTNVSRVHLVRVVARPKGSRTVVSFDFPILKHPVLESAESLRLAIHSWKDQIMAGASRAQDRVYDLWPETQSCVITLGL